MPTWNNFGQHICILKCMNHNFFCLFDWAIAMIAPAVLHSKLWRGESLNQFSQEARAPSIFESLARIEALSCVFWFKKELFLFRNVIPRPHFDTFCVCGADTAFRTNGWIYLWALVSTDQGGHAWSGTLLLVAWSVGASKGRMLRHMVVDFFFGPTIFAFLKQCEFPPVSNEPPGPTT